MKLKKIIYSVLLSLTVLCSGTAVSADVIIEPENDFYQEHYDECRLESESRRFTVQKDIDLYKSPLSKEKTAKAHKGDVLATNAFYTDKNGKDWGYIYGRGTDKRKGWFRLDETELIYDNISFAEEHKDEFREYSGELAGVSFDEIIYMWAYPHAPELTGAVAPEEWLPEENGTKQEQLERDIGYVYTDPAGGEWVYADVYVFGKPRGWIYVPNPGLDLRKEGIITEEEETTVSENIEAFVDVTDIPNANPTSPYEKTELALPLILAACAAALSSGLIAGAKKRGK